MVPIRSGLANQVGGMMIGQLGIELAQLLRRAQIKHGGVLLKNELGHQHKH